jgi:hypothetical protein
VDYVKDTLPAGKAFELGGKITFVPKSIIGGLFGIGPGWAPEGEIDH